MGSLELQSKSIVSGSVRMLYAIIVRFHSLIKFTNHLVFPYKNPFMQD